MVEDEEELEEDEEEMEEMEEEKEEDEEKEGAEKSEATEGVRRPKQRRLACKSSKLNTPNEDGSQPGWEKKHDEKQAERKHLSDVNLF